MWPTEVGHTNVHAHVLGDAPVPKQEDRLPQEVEDSDPELVKPIKVAPKKKAVTPIKPQPEGKGPKGFL